MEFGLWVEPEMVNLDSDLARAHPDWVLGPPAGPPAPSRHQHVLDLANPDAFAHVLEAVSSLVAEYGIDYLKWDHNRDLLEAVRTDAPGATGPRWGPRRWRSTGCSTSSGAATRAWRSSRAPAAGPGSTSGSSRAPTGSGPRTATTPSSGLRSSAGPGCSSVRSGWARTSARRAPTPPTATSTCRCGCSSPSGGHAGLEWDITTCTAEELDALRAWTGLYRELRPLLHTGDVVRSDHPDPALVLGGVSPGTAPPPCSRSSSS